VKERGILFSAPMVLALLAGRKTQTRRIVMPQPHLVKQFPEGWAGSNAVVNMFTLLRNRFGVPGDRLWVREAWRIVSAAEADIEYRADKRIARCPTSPEEFWRGEAFDLMWRPSIFMPRWASRITLEVTDVRVERLQDISEADAKAEGAFFTDYGRRCHHDWNGPGPCPAPPEHHSQKPGWQMYPTTGDDQCLGSPQAAFGHLWIDINGQESWDLNLWVWVVSFKPVEAT
jgi:hypothetical protein